jgi:hypothetical protein
MKKPEQWKTCPNGHATWKNDAVEQDGKKAYVCPTCGAIGVKRSFNDLLTGYRAVRF